MDEWAWRKGRRYGTLLCEPDRGHIVDLPPERNDESVAAWLRAHPGVQIRQREERVWRLPLGHSREQ